MGRFLKFPSSANRDYLNRNTALDGLRGYAAAQVVFVHSILILDRSVLTSVYVQPFQQIDSTYLRLVKFALTLANDCAVALFFILSGAVLIDSLHRSAAAGSRMVSLKFTGRRILRIYPTLLVCLTTLFLLNMVLADYNWPGVVRFTSDQLFSNMLLTEIAMHGATWTLQVELLAVPFLLVTYFLARHLGYAGLLVALGYAAAAFFYLPLTFDLPSIGACLYLIAAGCWIPTEASRRMFERLPRGSWMVAVAGLLAVRSFMPWFSIWVRLLQVIFGFLVVGLVYYRRAGAMSRFLELPFSQRLGTSSYSFYLFNVVIMNILLWLVVPSFPIVARHPLEAGIVLAVITTMLTMPVARISYDFVEVPFMRLGQKIFGSKKDRALPAPLPAKLSAPDMRELLEAST